MNTNQYNQNTDQNRQTQGSKTQERDQMQFVNPQFWGPSKSAKNLNVHIGGNMMFSVPLRTVLKRFLSQDEVAARPEVHQKMTSLITLLEEDQKPSNGGGYRKQY